MIFLNLNSKTFKQFSFRLDLLWLRMIRFVWFSLFKFHFIFRIESFDRLNQSFISFSTFQNNDQRKLVYWIQEKILKKGYHIDHKPSCHYLTQTLTFTCECGCLMFFCITFQFQFQFHFIYPKSSPAGRPRV